MTTETLLSPEGTESLDTVRSVKTAYHALGESRAAVVDGPDGTPDKPGPTFRAALAAFFIAAAAAYRTGGVAATWALKATLEAADKLSAARARIRQVGADNWGREPWGGLWYHLDSVGDCIARIGESDMPRIQSPREMGSQGCNLGQIGSVWKHIRTTELQQILDGHLPDLHSDTHPAVVEWFDSHQKRPALALRNLLAEAAVGEFEIAAGDGCA